MKMENLGQIASNADSARLADKVKNVDPFLGKVKIEGPDHKIDIPNGAKFRRQQSGYVLFFIYTPSGTKNNFEPIQDGARLIQYNQYEEHAFNTHYGDPTIHY